VRALRTALSLEELGSPEGFGRRGWHSDHSLRMAFARRGGAASRGQGTHLVGPAGDHPRRCRRALREPGRGRSFCQRQSVLTPTLAARAASSTFRCVRSAAIAASSLRPIFALEPAIDCHFLPITKAGVAPRSSGRAVPHGVRTRDVGCQHAARRKEGGKDPGFVRKRQRKRSRPAAGMKRLRSDAARLAEPGHVGGKGQTGHFQLQKGCWRTRRLAELMVFYCERAAGFCSDIGHQDEGQPTFAGTRMRQCEIASSSRGTVTDSSPEPPSSSSIRPSVNWPTRPSH
jgi:hypothetical protein